MNTTSILSNGMVLTSAINLGFFDGTVATQAGEHVARVWSIFDKAGAKVLVMDTRDQSFREPWRDPVKDQIVGMLTHGPARCHVCGCAVPRSGEAIAEGPFYCWIHAGAKRRNMLQEPSIEDEETADYSMVDPLAPIPEAEQTAEDKARIAQYRAAGIDGNLYAAAGRDSEYTDPTPDREDDDDDGCTCKTYAVASAGGDGYGSNFTDSNGCPVHDPDEPPAPDCHYCDGTGMDQHLDQYGEENGVASMCEWCQGTGKQLPVAEPDNSVAIEMQERSWDSYMYGE